MMRPPGRDPLLPVIMDGLRRLFWTFFYLVGVAFVFAVAAQSVQWYGWGWVVIFAAVILCCVYLIYQIFNGDLDE